MNLKEQAAILAAAIEGKTLKVRRKGDDKTWTAVFACPNAEEDSWFDFYRIEYAIVEPEPRILHQYIIKDSDGRFCLSYHFYGTTEEAQSVCTQAKVIGPALWTRIEVPE